MKSLVQRLSPGKSKSMKALGTGTFNAPENSRDGSGEVAVELMVDRIVVQDGNEGDIKGLFFNEIAEIEWNYEKSSVKFKDVNDNHLLVTLATLSQFEASLATALRDTKVTPAMTYIGVFAGTKQPRILQQRRATLLPQGFSQAKLSPAKRRELLLADRPPRTDPVRDTLFWEYIRTGGMTFSVTDASSSAVMLVCSDHHIIMSSSPSYDRIIPYYDISSCKKEQDQFIELKLQSGESFKLSGAVSHHLCQVVWFYINQKSLIPASPYGRQVYKPSVDNAALQPAFVVNSTIKHQGPLSKTASEGFHLTQSWKKKHACVYDTPLGAWLCYYDSVAHMQEKGSKCIDLCSVVCIRPQSAVADAPKLAFDIVTLYRTWSFCANDEADYNAWLQILGDYVDRTTALVPDVPLACEVKLVQHATAGDTTATLSIAAHGVDVINGPGPSFLEIWYYTDIHKWSLVLEPTPALFLSCFVDDQCTTASEFLFQTKNAAALCQAIEFHVAKCLAKVDILIEDIPPPPIPSFMNRVHKVKKIVIPSLEIHNVRRVIATQ
ncbi:unnamed protein product [Aphanomyces euteiches]|uniref:PH domain-containing protein n=1 Tax=Aphanomyces euteiches TaxID=100861 RepID=A0A6G0WJH4_9STRA|nr:hypothetical protein Ae201684_014646 [Aphanomyces euteiches]KAH9081146.1 hypothetical protein Ae201684P_012118 [Aphanomyces euteiches]KAH9135740.1 hypothetical protein AeRB84_018891 [Aphanomyces euteiches]